MKRRALVMALTLAVCHVAASGSMMAEEFQVTENWSIDITPAQKVPAQPSVSGGAGTVEVGGDAAVQPVVRVDSAEYQRIYRSIPFNRAEYNANPNYRHDSAMEILTGNARHQTIIRRETTAVVPVTQTSPVGAVPYRYNNPSRGLNYYFYFPYWNYRGIY
ncbi:MAG: hypothetical protein JNL58_18890 [Planctomyces sp.]|nr:hypothetical protein [Planctomyces sp.]